MGTINVKQPGLLTTLQDSGRFEHQQSGVCVSGVMDSYAHRVGNILVGNENTNEAVMEITMMGPVLEFETDAYIAITGADIGAMIDNQPVSNWQGMQIKAGSILSFKLLKKGVRSYLAVAGGFDVPVVMGSKSTFMRAKIGGFEGRAIKKDDIIKFNDISVIKRENTVLDEKYIPEYRKEFHVRVVLGPQDDYFTDEGIATFLENPYTVTQQYDRMGYRMEGEKIEHKITSDIISDGIVMGAIQVPGQGEPIILMADRQTAGGYTKIAAVISCDLPKVGQAKAGDIIRFRQVTVQQAQEAYIKNEALFKEIKNSLK